MSVIGELEEIAPVVLPLLYELVKDIEAGTLKPIDIARRLVGIGEQIVPHDELALYLTEAGRSRGELLGDIAQDQKFPNDGGDP